MKLKFFWRLSLLLILLVGGCQLFSPSNVETVVAEDHLDYWNLSPNGDYIVYGAPRGKNNYLLNLATGEKHKFDCTLHWWDSYHFGCYDYFQLSVIDVETLTKTPLIEIDLTKNPRINYRPVVIETLLTEADLIYRPESVTHTIYILASNYQLNPEKNYIVSGLTNTNKLLANYTVNIIPRDQPADLPHGNVLSPNGLYYYNTYMGNSPTLAIYAVDTAKIVAEFSVEETQRFEIRGWEIDSSGVYFHHDGFGFGRRNSPQKILKLKVPDE